MCIARVREKYASATLRSWHISQAATIPNSFTSMDMENILLIHGGNKSGWQGDPSDSGSKIVRSIWQKWLRNDKPTEAWWMHNYVGKFCFFWSDRWKTSLFNNFISDFVFVWIIKLKNPFCIVQVVGLGACDNFFGRPSVQSRTCQPLAHLGKIPVQGLEPNSGNFLSLLLHFWSDSAHSGLNRTGIIQETFINLEK